MTIITPIEGSIAIAQRKKLGKRAIYGKVWYGLSCYGISFERAGIYQMRPTPSGRRIIKMKFYEPTNPQTEAQQANRAKLGDAVAAYANLTEEQYKEYKTRAVGLPMTGYNLFIREYLLSH